MTRVKAGNRRLKRRKKITKQTSGNFHGRRNLFRTAAETLKRAMYYSFRDRKQNKRNFRTLWTARINAALTAYGYSYSRFIHALKLLNIELNRKMLSELAIHNPDVFKTLVEMAMAKVKAA